MFVECVKNNGISYLRLMEGIRVTNKNGDRVSYKKLVLSIGPLSRYDDGKPDYVERLKKSFKDGTPLIPALEPYCQPRNTEEVYHFSVTEGSPDCFGHPKLFSHVLLERILKELGLNTFFSTYKGHTNITYDLYGFAKLLIFSRLLRPASRYTTVRQNQDYYEPVLGEHNPDNVYDTLDFFYDNKDKIVRRINTNLVRKAGRSPEIICYDIASFCFGINDPYEEGNIIEKYTDVQEDTDKYHELTRIEDQFRVIKGDLDIRTFYVRTTEHMTAHILICLITLIMLRIIQKRIAGSGQNTPDPDICRSSGLNADRIKQALLKWKVDMLPGDLYRFMDVDDPDLKLILDAFGIEIPAKLYRRAELKHIKTSIKVFI